MCVFHIVLALMCLFLLAFLFCFCFFSGGIVVFADGFWVGFCAFRWFSVFARTICFLLFLPLSFSFFVGFIIFFGFGGSFLLLFGAGSLWVDGCCLLTLSFFFSFIFFL